MVLAIGIRSLITREGAHDLLQQARDARKTFPDAKIVLAACGERVPEETAGHFDEVAHYSDKAEGHGKSWLEMLRFAERQNADSLIVTDGNAQHVFANVRKAYGKAPAGLTVPQRTRRVIFTGDPVDGATLEDLENAFVRQKWKPKIRDLQSGLFIIRGRENYSGLAAQIAKHDS